MKANNSSSSGEKKTRWPSWRRKLLALTLSCLVAVLILELFLRWYNPLSLRVHGNRITLPKNEQTVIRNTTIDKVDAEITQTRNSLGFRGPEPPRDFDRQLTLIAVGGSTTECFYLSDGFTWPEQLQTRLEDDFKDVWVNNAGLDGHSTFGHRVLLDSYLAAIKPKIVLYLVGVNEVGNDQHNRYDGQLLEYHGSRGFFAEFYDSLVERSAIFSLIENLRRHKRAEELGLTHGTVGHAQLGMGEENQRTVSEETRAARIAEHQTRYLPAYRQRLMKLVARTRSCGIEPILITQPALYGYGIDDETGTDLAKLAVLDVNGEVQWQVLELYNDVTREVGKDLQVSVIDLAGEMPKTSLYFYDFHHFTNEGAEKVGEIVGEKLKPHLSEKYAGYVK